MGTSPALPARPLRTSPVPLSTAVGVMDEHHEPHFWGTLYSKHRCILPHHTHRKETQLPTGMPLIKQQKALMRTESQHWSTQLWVFTVTTGSPHTPLLLHGDAKHSSQEKPGDCLSCKLNSRTHACLGLWQASFPKQTNRKATAVTAVNGTSQLSSPIRTLENSDLPPRAWQCPNFTERLSDTIDGNIYEWSF